MIQSPEDPPERPDAIETDLPAEEVDTRAPDRRLVSGSPTAEEDPQVQYALHAARLHARLLREGGVELVGVYLAGSAALGDRWPHSDIDTYTVVRSVADLESANPGLLVRVHDQMATEFAGTYYDTTYLEYGWLSDPPTGHPTAPMTLLGVLTMDAPAGITPVNWLELASSITADGEPVADLPISVDLDQVASYTRANLSSYWAEYGERLAAAAADKPDDAPLTNSDPVVWTVLGAPRLAAMLDRVHRAAPGEVPPLVSKTEAGDWVRTHLPEHADLAERALAERHGRPASFTVGDAASASRLVTEVIMVANSR